MVKITPDIQDTEFLLRQLSTLGEPPIFDAGRSPPIHMSAFLPSSADVDGLSLLRKQYRALIWAAYRPQKPSQRFLLTESTSAEFRSFATRAHLPALTFSPCPDALDDIHGEPWAHCIVPEINIRDYRDRDKKALKKQIKNWAVAIANRLSQAPIHGPFPEPDHSDPYRP